MVETRQSITANLEDLADVFKYLKLTPRQFDPLIGMVRKRCRENSRSRTCHYAPVLRYAKMPRKDFIKSFPTNETDMEWVSKLVDSGADWANGLKNQEHEILRCQRKLAQVESESQLSIAQIKDINRRVTMGEAMARRAKERDG
jgi:RNA polymerase primary sigma factor